MRRYHQVMSQMDGRRRRGLEAWAKVASDWFITNDTGHAHTEDLVWSEYAVDLHRIVPTLTTTIPESLQNALRSAGLQYEWPATEVTEGGMAMSVDKYDEREFTAIMAGLRLHCPPHLSALGTADSDDDD
jgi:hypothetical protein